MVFRGVGFFRGRVRVVVLFSVFVVCCERDSANQGVHRKPKNSAFHDFGTSGLLRAIRTRRGIPMPTMGRRPFEESASRAPAWTSRTLRHLPAFPCGIYGSDAAITRQGGMPRRSSTLVPQKRRRDVPESLARFPQFSCKESWRRASDFGEIAAQH